MEWLMTNWKWITLGVTAASTVANITPNDTDKKVKKAVNTVLNIFALNGNVKGNLNK